MQPKQDQQARTKKKNLFIWFALFLATTIPIIASGLSPLLAWRSPIYIIAGFAGVASLALLLIQPLLAGGYLPDLSPRRRLASHRWIGISLLALILIHVGGLWITSPPDVIDAITFNSPTPFSAWGVVAMWALFVTAVLAATRKAMRLSPQSWKRIHTSLAVIIVSGSSIHALLIEGTMEMVTKTLLCMLVVLATAKLIFDLKLWKNRK